jgi:signal transduction histidine kinase
LKKKQDKFKENNTVRDNLLRIISHDVYSPLRFATMIGKTVVLQNAEMDKDEILSTLEDINLTNAKILLLLSNILKVVEFESGEYVPFFFDEDLHTLVQEKMDFFKLLAKNKGVQLVNNVPSSIYIKTDKTIFCTILQNLISNALKFTSSNGKVEVSAVIDDSFITIFINDTGKGMPAKMVAAIEKGDTITIMPDTENVKGNGLGWSLIKELILVLNGKFKVASEINKGTIVSLQFPMH